MIELVVDTKACKGKNNEINYIEHVQAYISKTKFEKLTIIKSNLINKLVFIVFPCIL